MESLVEEGDTSFNSREDFQELLSLSIQKGERDSPRMTGEKGPKKRRTNQGTRVERGRLL